jgi:hypothetical protein
MLKQLLLSASSRLALKHFADRYPRLLDDLQRFSFAKVVCLSAGLQTQADLHANTLRLEALTHLAAAYCAGVRGPKRKDLDRWLNDWLGQGDFPRLEDPPEDLFSENVVGSFGNRICFTGLWESVGTFLQDIVDVLLKAPEELRLIERSVFALLTFSHVVALNAKVRRYELGRGEAKQRIVLPREEELDDLCTKPVIFKKELAVHGISEEALAPFILDLGSYKESSKDQSLENSDLVRRPIIDLGESLVLALPGAVGVAIQMFVVAAMKSQEQEAAFKRMLRLRQADTVLNRLLPNLDVEPLDWRPSAQRPAELGTWIDEAFLSFDADKVCHVILLHGGFESLPDNGPASYVELEPAIESQLATLVNSRAQELLSRSETKAGMTLIVRCGLAGGFSMSWPKTHGRWHLAFIPINDLDFLSYSDDASLLTLWKLLDFREELESKDIAVFEFNGLLNLYAYWQQSGHELAPRQVAIRRRAVIQIATNYIQTIRHDVRQRHDPHAAPRQFERRQSWIVMHRREAHPYFADVTHSNLYVSHERIRHGILMGVAEGGRNLWWLVCEPDDQKLPPEGVVRVWDALLNWMGLAVKQLDMPTLPTGPLNVDLRYGMRKSWDRAELHDARAEAPSVEAIDERTIRVTIGPGFYKHVANPRNIAERLLVRSFLEGAHRLAGIEAEERWYETCIDSIFGGSDARMIHSFHAKSWRDMATQIALPKWRKVRDEDSARVLFDLMPTHDRDEPLVIRGKERVNEVLHAVVDRLWERIKARLEVLDQVGLITRLVENIESAHREVRQWRLSARAIRGLHGTSDRVVESALKAERDLQTAILCSRALIEMTICEALPSGGRTPSNEDIDFLLAGASQLIYVARCSDALHAGWIPPRLIKYQNGAIDIDQSFHNLIVQPYHSQGFRDRFELSARRYESAIQPITPSGDEAAIDHDFLVAFQDEFGLELRTFTDIVRSLGEMALDANAITMRFSPPSVLGALVTRLGANEAEFRAFLERFTLLPRATWPTHKPQGAEGRDWQPWRFRRRLSLVMRPLIGIKGANPQEVVVAPGLLEEAARFLLQSLGDGSFNPEHCRSNKMRQWLGRAQREESEAFEDAVADALRKRGLEVRVRVSMTSVGAPPERGEIDVLAWNQAQRRVLIVECKDLLPAKMEAEIAEQLNRFRGKAGDELGAHMLRMNWLRHNRQALSRITGIGDSLRLADLLITSRPVPLQYTDHMPSGAPAVYNLARIDEGLKRTRMAVKTMNGAQ